MTTIASAQLISASVTGFSLYRPADLVLYEPLKSIFAVLLRFTFWLQINNKFMDDLRGQKFIKILSYNVYRFRDNTRHRQVTIFIYQSLLPASNDWYIN